MNRNTLLIVDDQEINRSIIKYIFEDSFNILEAEDGDQALTIMNQNKDSIVAVLLDIVMPGKNGYQVMIEMSKAKLLESIPVIVITAQDTSENIKRVFELGASDTIVKPFDSITVRQRVLNIIELNKLKLNLSTLVKEKANELQESKELLMDALISIVEHHSIESGHHVLRIRMFTKVLLDDLARIHPECGLDARIINVISSAAALHDVGKIAIPDSILKKPGPLTSEEFEIMKTHSIKGCEIIAGLSRLHDKEYIQYAYSICRHHHERYDGKGYPDHLVGDNIPLCAQVVGIADAYDALTTDRVYKKAYTPEVAYNMILNGQCGQFSPILLESFKNVRSAFAQLTKDYADGLLPQSAIELSKSVTPKFFDAPSNSLEIDQMKYFALLRLENSTTIEIDMESGVYHLVYKQSNAFDIFYSGDSFPNNYKHFSESYVHQDDRNVDLMNIIDEFLKSGSFKQSFQQRVLDNVTNTFVQYEVTILKIDTLHKDDKNILVIWKNLQGMTYDPAKSSSTLSESTFIGNVTCRLNEGFTIIKANDTFMAMIGYSREEFKEKFNNNFIEALHPDDKEHVRQSISRSLNTGDFIELIYRIITKDGRVIWLLDNSRSFSGNDGHQYLACVLTDITKTKQDQEELRLSNERLQIIMNQSNDIIFEWTIINGNISFSSNWSSIFGYNPSENVVNIRHAISSYLYPDDAQILSQMIDEISAGAPYIEIEVRIVSANGHYIWCRIRTTTQFDENGKPIKAVGVISNIDKEKRRTEDLIEKANRDSLTSLYNKTAAKNKIEKSLKGLNNDQIGALIILDLDNFKHVNDTQGHMFGDAVLIEVAVAIKQLVTPQSIVARIGGDEFLIYLSVSNRNQVYHLVEELVAGIRKVLINDDLLDSSLSCSIGVSCYPNDGISFKELFQNCDTALYHAKSLGKNQFCFYDKQTMNDLFAYGSHQFKTITIIDSDEFKNYESVGLIEYAFRMLYKADDVEAIIPKILEQIGRSINVSRVYIVEEENGYCNKTFEWSNEGVKKQLKGFEAYSATDNLYYSDLFDVNGILYCTDTDKMTNSLREMMKSRDTLSLLQCGIIDNGEYVGFVGFDDCKNKRIWTTEQINTLTFLSELISTFLLKRRKQTQLERTAEELPKILNSLQNSVYIVDPKTYEILYFNKATKELNDNSTNVKLGMSCFKTLLNRDKPCKICPVRELYLRNKNSLEICDAENKIWLSVGTSKIQWNNQECCLVSCFDISKYKKQKQS